MMGRGNGGELPPKNEGGKDKKDELVEKLTDQFEQSGFQVVDPNELMAGIKELYLDKTVEDIITTDLPNILKADPQFFIRNQINVENVSERLENLYGKNAALIKRYGDPAKRVAHSFKVMFHHIAFFLIDHPDEEELEHCIEGVKEILDGRWMAEEITNESIVSSEIIDINSIPIPNIYVVPDDLIYLFESFESVFDSVEKALPFLTETETRKVSMVITSAGNEARERAVKAKEVIERYLNEARSLVVNKEKPIPSYYKEKSNALDLIMRARKAFLV